MKGLILTYFDHISGPRIFVKAPESLEDKKVAFVPRLMDLDQKGFFTFENTANLIFEIPFRSARGGIETFMVSILLKEEQLDPNLFQDVLKEFVNEFSSIENICIGAHANSNEPEEQKQKNKLNEFFYSFYQDLPEETLLIDRNFKIMVLGLQNAGKTTIVDQLKDIINKKYFHEKSSASESLFFENLSITTYDLPIKRMFGDFWTEYFKDQDGFVFVIDLCDVDKFDLAKEQLGLLYKRIKNKSTPFLLLFNKKEISKESFENTITKFDVQKLKYKSIKIITISALTREGMIEAFDWLARKIIDRFKSQKN